MTSRTKAHVGYLKVIFIAATIGCNAGTVNTNKGSLSKEERDAAKAALKELNKLGSFAEAGINYEEYQSRVLDAKAAIDSSLLDIPTGPIKDALQKSIDAYVDGREFWNLAFIRQQGEAYFFLSKEELKRYSKYGLKSSEASKDMVGVFWLWGGFGAKDAEKLLSK